MPILAHSLGINHQDDMLAISPTNLSRSLNIPAQVNMVACAGDLDLTKYATNLFCVVVY